MRPATTPFTTWTTRHWATAAVAGVAVALAIGVPSDVIPNPVFGRPTTPVAWWSYPVLVATAILSGLLAATYVRPPVSGTSDHSGEQRGLAGSGGDGDGDLDRPGRVAGMAGVLSFFAVGCPTCNKLVVLAVGSSGALEWFAPAQPALAIGSVGLLAWALRARLDSADDCRIPDRATAGDIMAR